MNDVFANINKWFRANKLALNFEGRKKKKKKKKKKLHKICY
jgi:hypothetical protein